MSLRRRSGLLLAVALLATASPILAWDWSNPIVHAANVPDRHARIGIALFDIGSFGLRLGLLQTDRIGCRLRCGVSLADVLPYPGANEVPTRSPAQVHLGLTIVSLLREMTETTWSRALDVYLQRDHAVGNVLAGRKYPGREPPSVC
ncbi:MAG TPA: hypothetical protein VMH22_02190 [bacterium]|nr:hypothetical protein [bacterium]